MASRRTAAIALLLLRVVPLWASSLEHSVDPELLQDACVAGSEACGADVLSLRQLRGEPVRETVAIEDQGDSAEQSETAAGTGASLKALSGQGWPAWVVGADTSVSGWAWDIVRVKFLTITGEEVSPSTPGCHLVQSGTVDTPGYSALNAFSDDSSWWGGRKDHAHNMFYLGITCNWHVQVAAVQLQQLDGDHSAHEAMLYHSHWDHHTALATTQLATGRLQTIWEGVFGVRLVAADLRSGWAWDVRRLKVVVPSDYSVGFSGGELATDHAHPYFCHAVDSGNAGHTYDVANAFHDGHSWWGGRPDSTGKFFLGVECDQPFTWPGMDNIWFDQIDHVHYAHTVDVEVSTAFGWKFKSRVHVAASGLAPLSNSAWGVAPVGKPGPVWH